MSTKESKPKLVKFAQHVPIGKQLDMQSAVSDGQSILGVPIKLHFHDGIFFRIEFCGKSAAEKYSQLYAYSQVVSVITD